MDMLFHLIIACYYDKYVIPLISMEINGIMERRRRQDGRFDREPNSLQRPITYRLTKERCDKLQEIADRERKTLARLTREIISRYIDNFEKDTINAIDRLFLKEQKIRIEIFDRELHGLNTLRVIFANLPDLETVAP